MARLQIFGSVARGEAAEGSDLDLLVRFATPKSLFDHARLQLDLEDRLGVPVDLITERALNPSIRDRVALDLRLLYEG